MTEITRNESVTVSTASVVVSSSKPAQKRVDLVLRNFDAANSITITISDAQAAVANAGILLRPYDGIALSESQGYIIPQGTISAISSGASAVANLAVFERYL